ncbi:hypothetical protein [Aeromonas dhakensis]|uniref:hypothetical protein n=1 Tax=Aeromonas dhakensis TaxID=196024 RepID=UPI00244A0F25|nr:hypothetical protein [Aeromonas dhakensis]MDH0348318.1 hypothetical protein [Aeromonas dhakensis]
MTASTMQHGEAANNELFVPSEAIFGTHGTSGTRATSIMANGFETSYPGRVGFGSYFWFAENEECEHAHKLARQWHSFSERNQAYKDDDDRSCAVIAAKIVSTAQETFNLESPHCKAHVRRLLEAKFRLIDTGNAEERDECVCATYDAFIRLTEQNMGMPFKAVLCTVQLPKKFGLSDPVAGYTGNPYVVVARDSTAIQILSRS